MSIVLQHEIETLKKMISSLCAHAEEAVQKAVRSVLDRDAGSAQSVIDFDPEIDQMEVDVEEECLKILALHQPVATDLRFIIAALKVNNDLERVGDLAANIAQQGLYLAELAEPDGLGAPFDVKGMTEIVQSMLRESLDALIHMDTDLARHVRETDDRVDLINRNMYAHVQMAIREHPDRVQPLIWLMRVSNNLERIADHATNVAEDVIYMVEGTIIRHTNGRE